MDINGYLELNGYYISVHAHKEPGDRWGAWARFERLSDITKTHIPGMRRRVPTDFPSQEKAVSAAYDYARELVTAGDVGL